MYEFATRNDDEAFCNESAIPARGMELSCLSLGQTASSGPWPSPTPLFPTALDLFEDDRETVCELLGDVAGIFFPLMIFLKILMCAKLGYNRF